ncbi:hypothetical protein PPROV_000595100 [Pycnococcus provasolii]|uniref:Peptidase S1 domain-containing protein n=1 Tax=Pycnococcus provasolii TaxID=41880 RepID=A0A830HQB4_9CHLO|nr:hypothetical protein PPROV_000595100 [Pycnococcus provasolii]
MLIMSPEPNVVKRGAYPWIVHMKVCSGTLIAPTVILTAAHCVSPHGGANSIRPGHAAHIGCNDVVNQVCQESGRITGVYAHEKYTNQELYSSETDDGKPRRNFEYNVAVLILEKPSRVPVAKLATRDDDPAYCATSRSTVAGWGRDNTGRPSGVLLEVDLPVTSHERCEKVWGKDRIGPTMICAGFDDGGCDTCRGDSGGPIFTSTQCAPPGTPPRVFGIGSWGAPCDKAKRKPYGVYTSVASVRDWIASKMPGGELADPDERVLPYVVRSVDPTASDNEICAYVDASACSVQSIADQCPKLCGKSSSCELVRRNLKAATTTTATTDDDEGLVFDEKRCGTVKKIVTSDTKAEDLVGVTWVVGDLRFGREDTSWSIDDDWHFVDEDVPVQASGIRCVEGDLSISNTMSTVDLSPLANLAVIGGNLRIYNNAQLTTLTGLDGITTVGGDLWIIKNAQLTTLTALDGITTIGGDLYIWSNDQLTTLTGLDGITTVGGYLRISYNDQLTTLTGLDGITTVGGDLDIWSNDQLTTLTGLDGITTVGGDLEITSNAQLTTLTGLDGITTVGGYLRISYNDQLTTLTGLDGITTVGGDLRIVDNDQLTTLKALDGITTVGGNLEITSNAQLTTLAGLDSIPTVGGNVEIYRNAKLTTLTGLDGITTVGGDLTISNNPQLTDLAGLDSIPTVGGGSTKDERFVFSVAVGKQSPKVKLATLKLDGEETVEQLTRLDTWKFAVDR